MNCPVEGVGIFGWTCPVHSKPPLPREVEEKIEMMVYKYGGLGKKDDHLLDELKELCALVRGEGR